MRPSAIVFTAALLCAQAAPGQSIQTSEPVISRGGQGWSMHSGQTVGDGNNVVGGQVGWPGLSATFLHGATGQLDLGVRLTLINWGFEGRVNQVFPGNKLQGVARLQLVDSGKLNLGVEFAPGPLVYYRPSYEGNLVGLALPFKLQGGLTVGGAILLNFGMDLPMYVVFGSSIHRGLYLPILFGGGVEYFIDRRLAATFNMKMGPSIRTRDGDTRFAMETLIGVAYRL